MERPVSTPAVHRLPTYETVSNGTYWVTPKKEPESPPTSRIGDINCEPSPRSLSYEMLGVHADEPVTAGIRTPLNGLAEVDDIGMGSPSGGSNGASDMVPTNIQTAAASFPALLNIWARFATAKPVGRSPISEMQSVLESVPASSTVQAGDKLFAAVDNGRVSLRNNEEPVTCRPEGSGLLGRTAAAIHNANDEIKQRELYQLQLEILEHSEKVDLVENQFIEDMNASYQHQAEIARLANECDSLRARIMNLQKELVEKEAHKQRVDGARNQLSLKLAMSKQQLGEMKAEAATKRADLLARLKYVQIGQNAGVQPLGISSLEKHTGIPNQLMSTLNSNVLDTSKPPLSSNEIAMQTEGNASNRAMLPILKNKGAAVESRWSPISEIETAPEAPLEDAVQKLFESISQTPRRLGSEPQGESRTDERPVVISIIERDTDSSKQALSESRAVTPTRGNDNRRTEKSRSPERTSANPYLLASGKRQRVCLHWNRGNCIHRNCYHLHQCAYCGSSAHTFVECDRKAQICLHWNKSHCDLSRCPRLNVCMICHGDHGMFECPHKDKVKPEMPGRKYTDFCQNWNSSGLCGFDTCKRVHRCINCGGAHPSLDCPVVVTRYVNRSVPPPIAYPEESFAAGRRSPAPRSRQHTSDSATMDVGSHRKRGRYEGETGEREGRNKKFKIQLQETTPRKFKQSVPAINAVPQNGRTCHYWNNNKGYCRNGSQCRFLHTCETCGSHEHSATVCSIVAS
ncbi:uncharacterized protein SPPG_09450 [Spizellomyces punctatus DAOM BR117]|uniref:C3H1-type domain-containing protein n=1 Tax=Spizellomyces punctatus (strain DAOM BR117) TaxID=645134 RepID=A0A0L0H9N2_SPIPD|nr:uncharacterized protein SPPG_09450 [Spizellomyces punctatus DAOM BR117]KNC97726.1 hypothetical protein SPPG_09450 [Spizellomyces punctatus DAOM BR117]|eukprot:XP_016605766.1 hypothetical protein SPPG_09450 [Spizellomyces punctatus DAOM BR117]